MSLIAETAVSGAAYSFDMLFSYAVPDEMSELVACGCRVYVPFGRGNRRRIGVVMKLGQGDAKGLKKLSAVVDTEPVVSEELLGLAEYLHDNTFCTYFDAVKTMLPPAMSVSAEERFILGKLPENAELSDEAAELYEKLRVCGGDPNEYIPSYISVSGRKAVDELLDAGALVSDNIFRQAVGDAQVRMVRLTGKYISQPESFDLTPKQKKVAELLTEYGTASTKEAAYMCGVTTAVVKRLIVNGAAEEYEMEVLRGVEDGSEERTDPER